MSKFKEVKDLNDMAECTFSPRTNSQPDRVLSPNAFKRLHYNETEQRNVKMSKKEAEKMERFKQEYTFKPDRPKTKKLDHVSANKENDES